MQSSKLSRRRLLQASIGIGCGLLIPGSARAGNIHRLSGKVFINKEPATPDSTIRANDRVTTSRNGRISFSIDGDAFMLKEYTSMIIESKDDSIIDSLRLLTGRLLSVFQTGRKRSIITTNATIGIRGTACFLKALPSNLYYCNCYGKTVLHAKNMSEVFEATHHNAHQIDFSGDEVMGVSVAKVIDHDDDELRELEAYVGRVPKFDQ